VPRNWPIGSGPWFQGVYDLPGQRVLRFERTAHGQHRAPVTVAGLDDPKLASLLGDQACRELRDDVELLAGVGTAFDLEQFHKGALTPVFFGSALNNFGVEPFLEALLHLAPPPGPRESDRGPVEPSRLDFTGFVFKVQANMDPKHRDRMAFLRVCSGRFQKDMTVYHPRLDRTVRLSRAFRLFARDREPIEEAFPGDVIGVVSPGLFAVGDTVATGEPVRFPGIPRFAPEHFATLMNLDINRYKQFHKGLAQLEEEGAAQVLHATGSVRREPILAAVGVLQFDVILARLREEYGVEARIERAPYALARWVSGLDAAMDNLPASRRGTLRCVDRQGRLVILFQSAWDLEFYQREYPDITLAEVG
jgi:peptide chain release factor 3